MRPIESSISACQPICFGKAVGGAYPPSTARRATATVAAETGRRRMPVRKGRRGAAYIPKVHLPALGVWARETLENGRPAASRSGSRKTAFGCFRLFREYFRFISVAPPRPRVHRFHSRGVRIPKEATIKAKFPNRPQSNRNPRSTLLRAVKSPHSPIHKMISGAAWDHDLPGQVTYAFTQHRRAQCRANQSNRGECAE